MKLAHNNKGAIAVEFALVLAFILLPLFLGLVDAAKLLNAKAVLNRAAREGAISMMRDQPYSETVEAIEKVITDAGFDVSGLQIDPGPPNLRLTYTIPNFPMFDYPGLPFPDQVSTQATYQLP